MHIYIYIYIYIYTYNIYTYVVYIIHEWSLEVAVPEQTRGIEGGPQSMGKLIFVARLMDGLW